MTVMGREVLPVYLSRWLLLCMLCLLLQVVSRSVHSNRVVMTIICRDEAVNFRENLPKWLSVIDFYVFMMDTRTTDGSQETISAIFDKAGKRYIIVPYEFNGFGPARTQSLVQAWTSFPEASHVLIADPDWSPDLSTIDLSSLDMVNDVFRFTAYDRNGYTVRRMDWLLRHRQGLKMRYNVHEVLSLGPYTVKDIGWTVHEIERPGTWHTTVGHTSSMSSKRYEFDLQLLKKDLLEFGHDPHTHYYLGITHEAYAQSAAEMLGRESATIQEHLDEAVKYLSLRATAQYADEFIEERWAVSYQLGLLYRDLQVDSLLSSCDELI